MKTNILVLSKDDWANSGTKIAEAVNSLDDHCAECFVLNGTPFDYNRKILKDQKKSYVMEWIDKADLIIYKGDDGLIDPFGGYKIPVNKPIMVLFSGSTFLDKHKKILNDMSPRVDIIGAMRPDLLFSKNIKYIPHPVDCEYWKPVERKNEKIVIGHSVSNDVQRALKGTKLIENVVKQFDVEYSFIYKKSYEEARKMKQRCDIYIDNVGFRFYGNNGAESMALGIPTLTGLSESIIESGMADIFGSTYIDKHNIYGVLDKLINDIDKLFFNGRDARKWALKMHSYESVGKRIVGLV